MSNDQQSKQQVETTKAAKNFKAKKPAAKKAAKSPAKKAAKKAAKSPAKKAAEASCQESCTESCQVYEQKTNLFVFPDVPQVP